MSRNSATRIVCAVAIALLLASFAWADTLELKNGSVIKGKYMGGSDSEISFQVGSSVQRYAISDVASLSFDSSSRASAPAPAPPAAYNDNPQLAARPARPQARMASSTVSSSPSSVNVPVGTQLTVRTVDAVDSDKNQVGDKFQASLEEPLVVDGTTVVEKGATVYGRLSQASEAGHIQGRSELKLELTGIVVNGQTVPLVTGEYGVAGSSRGASTAKRVGAGAGIGALIGAIAGGGKGAAIGAGVGAGAGTAVQVMTKGDQVHVPSETLLQFTIQQDVRMPVSASSAQ